MLYIKCSMTCHICDIFRFIRRHSLFNVSVCSTLPACICTILTSQVMCKMLRELHKLAIWQHIAIEMVCRGQCWPSTPFLNNYSNV